MHLNFMMRMLFTKASGFSLHHQYLKYPSVTRRDFLEFFSKSLKCSPFCQINERFKSTSNASTKGQEKRKKVVILGTGWGSYSVLKHINKQMYDVVVVSPRNHFLFTPLLCSTTVGTLEFRSIIEPVRNTGFRDSQHFHLSYATNLAGQQLTCSSTLQPNHTWQMNFDKLVIGVGALTNTFGVPGVDKYAFFLKEIADARRIRNKLLSNIELSVQPNIDSNESKRLLHVIIVGGGPTGVEFGAELYDFVKQDVSRLYKERKDQFQVTLVESNKILGAFDSRLQSYAEKKISKRTGFNLVQDSVTEVTENSVTLKSGLKIPCGLVVWSTGLSPRDFTRSLDFPKNESGQILTDRNLRVKGYHSGNIFALGDCADIEGNHLPCTAQVAEKQGKYVADFLNHGCNEKKIKPFEFMSKGMLAYIGNYDALTDMKGLGKFKGAPSWFLWRSAYLTRLGSLRLRMQVPLDWTKTLLFGRDISRFE